VQYLYAAYSLKRSDDPTLSSFEDRKKAVAKWRRAIANIAQEEMGHLMTVQNLRRVLGLGPTFARNRFPMLDGLFPFDFHLRPLNQMTLAQYVVAESPTNDTTPPKLPEIIKVATGNDVMPVNHVGILYGVLGVIFAASPADIKRDASGKDPWYTMARDIAVAAYQQNPSEGAWHLNSGQFDPTTFPQQANANDFGATAGGVLAPPPADQPPQIRVWQCANQDDAKEALRDIGLQGEGPLSCRRRWRNRTSNAFTAFIPGRVIIAPGMTTPFLSPRTSGCPLTPRRRTPLFRTTRVSRTPFPNLRLRPTQNWRTCAMPSSWAY
jgi:hypothetical protein